MGYGKMGREIEITALSRGHEIIVKLDNEPLSDKGIEDFTNAEVAIEFTCPEAAVNNYIMCFNMGIPVVSGTTGWLDQYEEIRSICIKGNHSFFYSPNFSLGVNIFFEINKNLARLMSNFSDYDVNIEEIHHKNKIDAPSGTAISLAEEIFQNNKNKTSWILGEKAKKKELRIKAVREQNFAGKHTVNYDSDVDSLSITHNAKSRKGFAVGAIIAAEFLKDKKGFFGMEDLLGFGE